MLRITLNAHIFSPDIKQENKFMDSVFMDFTWLTCFKTHFWLKLNHLFKLHKLNHEPPVNCAGKPRETNESAEEQGSCLTGMHVGVRWKVNQDRCGESWTLLLLWHCTETPTLCDEYVCAACNTRRPKEQHVSRGSASTCINYELMCGTGATNTQWSITVSFNGCAKYLPA